MIRMTILGLLMAAPLLWAQAPEPDGAGVEAGTLPTKWATGGPNCLELPAWQIHEYNPDFYILRQSGCTHYEKPFLYLIFGAERALLVDTGAGEPDTAAVVGKLLQDWAEGGKRKPVELVVSHSHSHGDHVAGDAAFQKMQGVQFIAAEPESLSKAFGIQMWPTDIGKIDLGDRVVDVIPIPGHDTASVAYYDRRTGVLLTGDSLYPGRLYTRDWPAFVSSTRRMVDFTEGKIIAYVLGAHIEQSSRPYRDYPRGTQYQPEEHSLELGRAHLLELDAALARLGDKPKRAAYAAFTIWPRD